MGCIICKHLPYQYPALLMTVVIFVEFSLPLASQASAVYAMDAFRLLYSLLHMAIGGVVIYHISVFVLPRRFDDRRRQVVCHVIRISYSFLLLHKSEKAGSYDIYTVNSSLIIF